MTHQIDKKLEQCQCGISELILNDPGKEVLMSSSHDGRTTLISGNTKNSDAGESSADQKTIQCSEKTADSLILQKEKPLESNGVEKNSVKKNGVSRDRVIIEKPDHHEEKPVDYYKGDKFLADVCEAFIKDINEYGIFVIDSFLGLEKGSLVFEDVIKLHESGVFRAGQLVRNNEQNNNIRGDHITWVVGKEENCEHIGQLVGEIDRIILTANKKPNNGVLGHHKIDGRTKAMVACYPGEGTQYIKHVDNPNKDGRCITAIYYLNKDWNPSKGGVLRIFPAGLESHVAEIEPRFDRMLFFWSDRRNPHEVLPSFDTRYAITIWYFDSIERNASIKQYQEESKKSPEIKKI